MKIKHALQYLIAGAALAAVPPIPAANVTWDITPGTVGAGDIAITGGTGNWDTTNGNWTIDAGANNVAWNNAGNDTATFGGTAGTVTLGANATVGGLTFTADGYSVEPGNGPYAAILGVAGSTTSSTGGSIYSTTGTTTINANIDNAGFLLSVVGPGNKTIAGDISGSGGLTMVYGGTLTLAGDNTYTGKTSITANNPDGSAISVSSFNSVNGGTPLMASSSLGAPTMVTNGTILLGARGKQAPCTLTYTGADETTDRVMSLEFNGTASQTINASGSGLLKFTSAMTSNVTPTSASQTGKLVLGGTGSGEIVEGLPNLPKGGPTNTTAGLQKQDAGTWTLGGTSSVNATFLTGGALILNGTLNTVKTVAISSTATLTVDGLLGFAATTISNTATLNGSGSLGFDINGTTTDLVTMTGGTLTATNLTIAVNPTGAGLTEVEYVLVNASGGTIVGNFAGLTGAPGYVLNYDTPGQVKLISTGTPYENWATGGEPFDGDANGDGVKDGLAFLLGAASPSDNATGRLPTVTQSGGALVLNFNCLPIAARGTATLKVEHSTDLVGWTTTADVVPDADDAIPDNGVTFVVGTGPVGPPALNSVTATIESTSAAGGKLFGRLETTE